LIETTQSQFQPKHHTSPINSTTWETKSIASLDGKISCATVIRLFTTQNTKSFIILVNGRIVLENYFNTMQCFWYSSKRKNINVYRNRHCTTRKPWHQCKSFTIYGTVGQLPIAKENLITNKHLLNMTSD
jgi:hypothetical protein